MERPSVVIHIGLHKTATRYLQRAVFSQLEPTKFWINPEPAYSALRRAVRDRTPEQIQDAGERAREIRERAGNRTILFTEPSIAGHMYSGYNDYMETLPIVNSVFPEATVLLFVRRHADWLQSAYRQSLKKGQAQSIEDFLSYYGDHFHGPSASKVRGRRKVDALALAFDRIYAAYADWFGADYVYLFRQEDMSRQWAAVSGRLAEALGIENLPEPPSRVSRNRSFSALAIRLFVGGNRAATRKENARGGAGTESGLRHRVEHRGRRLRSAFIQHVFDKVVYRDWDLLERKGMREKLERHYADADWRLERAARVVLEEGPGQRARLAVDGAGADE